MKVLITGSSGLIGSEAVEHFDLQGHDVFGVIVHCAAQPSHDKASEIPLLDFEVNALGTINLLEAARQYRPDIVFIFLSTNKVYGEAPNEIPIKELATRYDYARAEEYDGVDETCRIDRTLHSPFGASKAAADLIAQEYGRYFNMKVGVFRGGCLTGPTHSGVELHGFLAYLVKVTLTGGRYTVYGYKGKQVRDNIHSHDVVRAIQEFAAAPRPGEVYNLGGGRGNSISMLEAIERIEQLTGRKLDWHYAEEARKGESHLLHLEFAKVQYPLPSLEDYTQPGCYSGGNGRSAKESASPFCGKMRRSWRLLRAQLGAAEYASKLEYFLYRSA